MHLELH